MYSGLAYKMHNMWARAIAGDYRQREWNEIVCEKRKSLGHQEENLYWMSSVQNINDAYSLLNWKDDTVDNN